jgi:Rhodanese-like domain
MPARDERVSKFPILMVGLGILIMVGSLVWFIDVTRKANESRADIAQPVASPRIPYPEIKRIRLGDSKAALDLKQAIFIDTRGEPYFSQGHIPGAISYNEEELSSHLSELDPNAWYILYCS